MSKHNCTRCGERIGTKTLRSGRTLAVNPDGEQHDCGAPAGTMAGRYAVVKGQLRGPFSSASELRRLVQSDTPGE